MRVLSSGLNDLDRAILGANFIKLKEVNQMKRRDDLLVGPKEKAIEAVKAGRKEEAIKYIEELYELFKPLHDRYSEWIQFLFSFIAERLGEGVVEEAYRGITMDIYKDKWVSMFKKMSPEEITRYFGLVHKSHYSNFYVEEDDEKFALVIPYCGSGGRMQKEGKKGRTGKAYPWSFDQEGVSYYCCHEGVFNMVFEELGFGTMKFEYSPQFDKEGKPTGGICRCLIYKKKP